MKQQTKPPEIAAATPSPWIQKPQPGKKILAQLWILVIMVLVFLLLTARGISPTQHANAQILEDLPGEKSIVSTSAPTATPTYQPAASQSPAALAAPETVIKVFTDKFSLRSGPGLNYPTGRKLVYGEELLLLGRLDDSSWLYIKTSDSIEGWISPSWVRLGGIDLNTYVIKTPAPHPERLLKVLEDKTNLRTGPGNYYVKIISLAYGDQLRLLGRSSDRTWLYVETSDGRDGWIHKTGVDTNSINLQYDYYPVKTPAPTETSTPVILPGIEGHWIDVDLSEQRLRAYDGTELVRSFLVSTGIERYPTETGQYRIYAKYSSALMHGSDYYLPDVPSIMYYSGDFSIHGTYWHHNFGTPMSHGCINMDINDAAWMFNWADMGTLVNIHY